MSETKVDHPSFGCMVISRSSGRYETPLYGSKKPYNSPVTITITASTRHDDHGNSSYMGTGNILVEIDMTEEQFARACNRMNDGGGTPCTIRRLPGKKLPDPPVEPSFGELALETLRQDIIAVQKRLNEVVKVLPALLEKPRLTVADKEKISGIVDNVNRILHDSAPFLADQFRRHLCAIVDAAQHAITPFDGQAALENQKP